MKPIRAKKIMYYKDDNFTKRLHNAPDFSDRIPRVIPNPFENANFESESDFGSDLLDAHEEGGA